jgi:hypothetical protein
MILKKTHNLHVKLQAIGERNMALKHIVLD